MYYMIVSEKTSNRWCLYHRGINTVGIPFSELTYWNIVAAEESYGGSIIIRTPIFLWFLSLCKRWARARLAARGLRRFLRRQLTGESLHTCHHPQLRKWVLAHPPPLPFWLLQGAAPMFLSGRLPHLSRRLQRLAGSAQTNRGHAVLLPALGEEAPIHIVQEQSTAHLDTQLYHTDNDFHQ